MGTVKNAARYQDLDKHDDESALSPPFDLVRSVFDVTGLASLLPPPMEFWRPADHAHWLRRHWDTLKPKTSPVSSTFDSSRAEQG